jgi:hypothetical protein
MLAAVLAKLLYLDLYLDQAVSIKCAGILVAVIFSAVAREFDLSSPKRSMAGRVRESLPGQHGGFDRRDRALDQYSRARLPALAGLN